MRLFVPLALVFLLAACDESSTHTKAKRDCDDLKGSARIMAMNCK